MQLNLLTCILQFMRRCTSTCYLAPVECDLSLILVNPKLGVKLGVTSTCIILVPAASSSPPSCIIPVPAASSTPPSRAFLFLFLFLI
jgi:hypothetical protein